MCVNKLSLIVLLMIGWFFLGTYWYVCEIGDFCGSEEGAQPVERLSESVKDLEQGSSEDTQDTEPVAVDTDGDGLLDTSEDANGNGEVDAQETDPNESDTDGDGFNDKEEIDAGTDPLNSASSPSSSETENEPEPPVASGSFNENVFFQPDSAQLTGASSNQDSISQAVTFAQDNEGAQITLTGFTAALASEVVADDEVLARSRAETVQSEMVAAGISESRITIDAQGDTSASDPADARRVTIEISQ